MVCCHHEVIWCVSHYLLSVYVSFVAANMLRNVNLASRLQHLLKIETGARET